MNNLSIIIPYSGMKDEGQTLLNLFTILEEIRSDDEIIMVNDSSIPIMSRTFARILSAEKNVKFCEIESDKEMNNSVLARNAGSILSSHDCLVFLDEDMRIVPMTLNVYRVSIEMYGLVFGRINSTDANGQTIMDTRLKDMTNLKSNIRFSTNCYDGSAGVGNMGIHADVFFGLNGFDSIFNGYYGFSDLHLLHKAALEGIQPCYDYKAAATHLYHNNEYRSVKRNRRIFEEIWIKK